MSAENARNQVVWIDIPVLDLDRAIKFYSAVLGAPVELQEYPGGKMGVLPHKEGSGGCLVTEGSPSTTGTTIYLNASGRLDDAIAAVEPHGGKILEAKHAIAPYGFRAVILDSEGNRFALHSM